MKNDDMVKTLGEDSPCYSFIKKWVADLKRGRESTDDDVQTGCPKSATMEGIHPMVCDCQTHSRDWATVLVSLYCFDRYLGMSKLSARWVPQMLTSVQKLNRLEISRAQSDPADFLQRTATQEETWVHHFNPESKNYSNRSKQVLPKQRNSKRCHLLEK